jgi:hypothetical protein
MTAGGLHMPHRQPIYTGTPWALKMRRNVMGGPFQHLFITNVLRQDNTASVEMRAVRA